MVYFGRDPHVIVGDFSILKEIMTQHSNNIINTSHSLINDILKENDLGIVAARDDNWRTQRSTAISILRSLGMGTDVMAGKIQVEVSVLIETISAAGGRPMDLRIPVSQCMTNVISTLTLGERFNIDDPGLVRLVRNVSSVIKYATYVHLLTSFKFLLYVLGDLFHLKKWSEACHTLTDFIGAYIAKWNHPTQNVDPPETFITAYLREIRKAKNTGSLSYLSERNLKSIVRVLFVAGTESTASTIMWFLLYMLHNPTVQENIYNEITAKIGTRCLPSMADKPKLVYLNAVILETFRMSNVVPTGQRREVSASFEVHGFTIPKGCAVWPLNFLIHHDKKIWGDPENFRPERFIGSDGTLQTPDQLIPFGIGKRICIGEGLARMELFLFLSAMCQRFKFVAADTSQELPTLEKCFAAVCSPRDFHIRAIPRDV